MNFNFIKSKILSSSCTYPTKFIWTLISEGNGAHLVKRTTLAKNFSALSSSRCPNQFVHQSNAIQNVKVFRQIITNDNSRRRWFKTSASREAIPPIILVVLSRVGKLGAMFLGRTFRIWWRKLPPEERSKYTQKVGKNRYLLSSNKF